MICKTRPQNAVGKSETPIKSGRACDSRVPTINAVRERRALFTGLTARAQGEIKRFSAPVQTP